MKLTKRIVIEVAHHEAVVREAYKDSVGVWTWSVGITSNSGHSVERYIDNPQSLEKCMEVYIWLLREKYLPAVERAFAGVELTEAQVAAALSFHWNTGAIERASWVQRYCGGDEAAARRDIMNWRKPPEIKARRRAERDLFFKGEWSNDGTMTEWTTVKPSGHIDWSKGRQVDVAGILDKLLGEPGKVPSNEVPQPWWMVLLKAVFGGKK